MFNSTLASKHSLSTLFLYKIVWVIQLQIRKLETSVSTPNPCLFYLYITPNPCLFYFTYCSCLLLVFIVLVCYFYLQSNSKHCYFTSYFYLQSETLLLYFYLQSDSKHCYLYILFWFVTYTWFVTSTWKAIPNTKTSRVFGVHTSFWFWVIWLDYQYSAWNLWLRIHTIVFDISSSLAVWLYFILTWYNSEREHTMIRTSSAIQI